MGLELVKGLGRGSGEVGEGSWDCDAGDRGDWGVGRVGECWVGVGGDWEGVGGEGVGGFWGWGVEIL